MTRPDLDLDLARAASNEDWCMWCGHWRTGCECDVDEDDSPPPCCPSCGVAIVDHLGLHGTCAEVQRLRAACESALCMLVEGPDVLEPGQSTREAKAILSAALNPTPR